MKISVADDGDGYPEKMLLNLGAAQGGLGFYTGSAKLGLFFFSRIAEQHNNNNKHSYIKLENVEGGGVFSIWLP